MGLALCTVIGHFAHRKRIPLLRWLGRARREEDSLGFVFVEYDDSTWGTPPKGAWREMPAFEAGSREREGGEAHARVLSSSPLALNVEEVHPIPSARQPDSEAPPDDDDCREVTFAPPTQTGSGPHPESNTIAKTYGRDLDDTPPPTRDINARSVTNIGAVCKSVIGHTLGLGLGDKLELSTLASSELAAVLALHAGAETLDVLALPGMREQMPLDTSEEEVFTVDSLSSGLVACTSSSTEESSGSEDDYELRRVETRSMDFKRGFIVSLGAMTDTDGEGGEKQLPPVVISGSSSELFSSRSNRVSGMSEGTIDLGDFPRPPVICL